MPRKENESAYGVDDDEDDIHTECGIRVRVQVRGLWQVWELWASGEKEGGGGSGTLGPFFFLAAAEELELVLEREEKRRGKQCKDEGYRGEGSGARMRVVPLDTTRGWPVCSS